MNPPAGPRVVAVVVAHPSRTRLAETLGSLGEQTYRDVGVVVACVGDMEVPEQTGVQPTVVRIEEPAGFSEAVMKVLDEVDTAASTYLLLLHDDVRLEAEAIERMVETASKDESIAAVGAKLVEWFDPTVLQEVGASLDRFAIRRSDLDAAEIDHGQRDDASDVFFCSDACLLVRLDAFEAAGGLDPDAWPFYEDVDLCWRLRAGGKRIVVEPAARAKHASDLSRGRRLLDQTTLRHQAEAGRLRFMLTHYSLLGLAVLLPQLVVASLARVLTAVVRRELWRARITFGAWLSLVRSLPAIIRKRRQAPERKLGDRELLALATRGAAGDVRGERAERASRILASLARLGDRAVYVARQPATWVTAGAGLVVVILLRNVLFGGTFVLGEIRDVPPLADALSNHFGSVQREGLDPFGPASAGAVLIGLLRSVVGSAALAQKLVLLLPVALAGLAGASLGRSLGLGDGARRWLGLACAVNPATLVLLRDGGIGALVVWAAVLWMVGRLLAPSELEPGWGMRVRFVAQWSLAFAAVAALHPQGLVWLVVVGSAVGLALAGDGRTQIRSRILATGAAGSFVLLAPWSFEWIALHSPLFGRPGWLVNALDGGLEQAGLGASWLLVAWLALAVAAAFFVGLSRLTLAFMVVAALAVVSGTTGAFGRETMLAVGGACALVILAVAVRRITEDLPRYELGGRQAAVIGGVVACAVIWFGGVLHTAPSGAQVRDLPVMAGVQSEEVGRVLWLAQTTGGVRSWTTLSFAEQLGAFPAPGGVEERLMSRGLEAARTGRTHRLGGVLALGDISHVVALDAESRRGLGGQADVSPQEQQGRITIYRNDAWRGPAVLLSAAPTAPLDPAGLANILTDPRRLDVSGWPFGPLALQAPETGQDDREAVVYLASGRRGGLQIEGSRGRMAAAGIWVPAQDISGTVGLTPPGRWWRWMLPLQAAALMVLVVGWLAAAYVGRPLPPARELAPDPQPAPSARLAVLTSLVLAAGAVAGWSGAAWGVGTPFLSAAWYCPPVGEGFQQRIAVANPNSEEVPFLVRRSLAAAPSSERRISPRGRETADADPEEGAVVESFGRRLVVASEVEREGDRDAALCADRVREMNVFPDGGRAATRARERLFERYVIYNPFPDPARASVQFIAPDETISPPVLQDVTVEPGSFVVIDPEEQFEPMLDLSTSIRVWQGRAVVARRLSTEVQLSWSLAHDEVTRGVLPRARTLDGFTNLLVVNAGEELATLTIEGAGEIEAVERFEVPPRGRNEFSLAILEARASDLVASVSSDRPVFVESLVVPEPEDRSLVSVMPLLRPERRWVVPLAEDRELILANPGSVPVRVTVQRLGEAEDGAIDPVTVEANEVVHLPLGGGEFGVEILSAGAGVVASVVGPSGSMPAFAP